jgi:lactoylglutathione lyase
VKFTFAHNNINVLDLEKSLVFYKSALGLEEARRHEAKDGSFVLVYLGDGRTSHRLELTWLRDRKEPYKHKEMGIVCYENPAMGIYFIEDPDGYWLEILPKKRKP